MILLVAAVPPVGATSGASAAILSPSADAVVPERSHVVLEYTGYAANATNASGNLFLDGVWAGNFVSAVLTGERTLIRVPLDLRGFERGPHELTARVFSDRDAPVDTPPVAIHLDAAPDVTVDARYDHEARQLVATVTVTDEGSANVTLRAGFSATSASFSGTKTMRLDGPHAPGLYEGIVDATDGLGQKTRANFTFEVRDARAVIEDLQATYSRGGLLRVSLRATDPDGEIVDGSFSSPAVQAAGILRAQPDGSWAGQAGVVAPSLGEFTGTVRLVDAHGGWTQANFTFTISGENEVVLQRRVTTDVGAYADAARIPLPRLFEGALEICVPTCDDEPPSNASCVTPTVACGEPQVLSFRPCGPEPRPSDGLLQWGSWYAVQAADRGSVFEPTNTPLNIGWPDVAVDLLPGESLGLCDTLKGQLSGGFVIDMSITSSSAAVAASCRSTGESRSCAFSNAALGPWTLDLRWLQAAGRTVEVRVSGIVV